MRRDRACGMRDKAAEAGSMRKDHWQRPLMRTSAFSQAGSKPRRLCPALAITLVACCSRGGG